MSAHEWFILLLLVGGMAAMVLVPFVILPVLMAGDDSHMDPSRASINARKHRAKIEPLIIVQTYFTITEAPFGHPIDLAYGAKVAILRKYAALSVPPSHFMLYHSTAYSFGDFHLLIQLPGAFIVR